MFANRGSFALLLVLAILFGVVPGTFRTTTDDLLIEDGPRVELQTFGGAFDPTVEGWPLPPNLDPSLMRVSNLYYVVQFDRDLDAEAAAALTRRVDSVVGYLPDHAYLVRSARPDSLLALPHLRWVGGLPIYLKLPSSYIEGPSGGPGLFDVSLFPDLDQREAVRFLEALGELGPVVARAGSTVTMLTPAARLPDIASIEGVYAVVPHSDPIPMMDNVRSFTGAQFLFGLPLGERIEGQGVIGEVKDDGIDIHRCFPPVLIVGPPATVEEHGTAVFGEVFSTGNPQIGPDCVRARGMLPRAAAAYFRSFQGTPIPHTKSSIAEVAANGGVFQTNSWGPSCPQTIGPSCDEPWGPLDPADDGKYDGWSQDADDAVLTYDVTVLYAAGNRGGDGANPRPYSIGRTAAAKNVVAVGALFHWNDVDRSNDCWSSPLTGARPGIGPTRDGRFKPDLVGPFDAIFTTDTQGPAGWGPGDYVDDTQPPEWPLFGGTSGATPVVAGAVGLVHNMYNMGRLGPQPSLPLHASTVKAILIANAFQLPFGSNNPSCPSLANRYFSGWGIVDVRRVYDVGARHLIRNEDEAVVLGGGPVSYTYDVDHSQSLKISLVWTDPPALSLEDPNSVKLINDLDLVVTSPDGTVLWGNHGLDTNLYTTSTPVGGETPDTVNNVENVFIQVPPTGRWNVEVRPRAVRVDADPATPEWDQPFALVVSHSGTMIAPAAITNLQVNRQTVSQLRLSWTAPGDDGSVGTASEYDVRYRTDGPVSEANWGTSSQAVGEPLPSPAGSAESFVVAGLTCDPAIRYYFAVKTRDEAFNWAPISSPNPAGVCAEGEIRQLWTAVDPNSGVPSTELHFGDVGGTQTFYFRMPKSPDHAQIHSATFTITGATETLSYTNSFDVGLDADPGQAQDVAVQDGNALLSPVPGQIDQQALATDISWDIKTFEGLGQSFAPQQPDLRRVDLYLHIIAGPPGGDPADPGPVTLTVRVQSALPCPLEDPCVLGSDSFTFTSDHDGWWPFYFDISGLTSSCSTCYISVDGYEGYPGLMTFEGALFGGQSNPYPAGTAWRKQFLGPWLSEDPRDLAFKTYSTPSGYATFGYFQKTVDRQSPISKAFLTMDQTSPAGTSVRTWVWDFPGSTWFDLGTGDKQHVDVTGHKSANEEVRVKLELSGPGTLTPYVHALSIETEHIPADVQVFVGNTMIRSYPGVLASKTVSDNEPPYVPLSQALQDFLDANPPDPEGYVWIPVRLLLPAAGGILVTAPEIRYCWRP